MCVAEACLSEAPFAWFPCRPCVGDHGRAPEDAVVLPRSAPTGRRIAQAGSTGRTDAWRRGATPTAAPGPCARPD